MLLAASVSISWVFAKSIQNVSLLGAQYGLVGCAAYGECCMSRCALVSTQRVPNSTRRTVSY